MTQSFFLHIGIELENAFALEAYTGLFRITLLSVGIKFKLDHLSCATCLNSVIFRTIAELPISDGATSSVADAIGFDDFATGLGRRMQTKEDIVPKASKPTLPGALAKYQAELGALGFDIRSLTAGTVSGHQSLPAGIASAPSPSDVGNALNTLLSDDAALMQGVRQVLAAAIAAYDPDISSMAAQAERGRVGLEAVNISQGARTLTNAAAAASALQSEASILVNLLLSRTSNPPSLFAAHSSLEAAVAQLSASLVDAETTGTLQAATDLSNWVLDFVGAEKPARPAWQVQAQTSLRTEATLHGGLYRLRAVVERASVDLGHMSSSPICHGVAVADAAAARGAISESGGNFGSLCCSVQGVLAQLVADLGSAGIRKLHSVLGAVNRRSWVAAASMLRGTSWCAANLTQCDIVTTTLASGCVRTNFWADAPTWMNSFRATGVHFTSPSVLAFEAQLTISGSLSCGYQTLTVHVPLQQNVSWAVDCCTELRNGTIRLKAHNLAIPLSAVQNLIEGKLQLDQAGGIIAANSSSWAWWHGSEQLVLRSDLLQAFQLGAVDALCATSAADVHMAAAAHVANISLQLGTGGAPAELFTRTRSDPQTAASSMHAARRLAGEPENPVAVDTVRCSMQCPAGALRARAITDEPHCLAQPQFQGQKRAVLDASNLTSGVDNCLMWLEQDYASCEGKKVAADMRFVACFNKADRGANCPIPSGSIDLSSWWRRCLTRVQTVDTSLGFLGLLDGATAELATAFDCATFGQLQSSACSCDPSSTSLENERVDHLSCLTASVGNDLDPLAENRATDQLVVMAQMRALGFLAEAGSRMEHASRVLHCAAAGVLRFEQPCDAIPFGECRVAGVPCASPVVQRGTCLDVPSEVSEAATRCSRARVELNSTELDWLRAQNAPAWVSLPSSSCGLVIGHRTPEDAMRIWGTSWLADALIEAARLYAGLSSSDSRQRPITVSAAALREGGNVLNEMGYQTGLEARIKLPSNVSIANIQAVALARAGFSLFLADCDGPQCVLLPPSPLPPDVSALRVAVSPPTLIPQGGEERVDCNGPAAVAVSQVEMGDIVRAADELQLRARNLQSVFAALESAWRVKDVGHAAEILQQTSGYTNAFVGWESGAFQLSHAVSELQTLLGTFDDAVDDGGACAWAKELSESVTTVSSATLNPRSFEDGLSHLTKTTDLLVSAISPLTVDRMDMHGNEILGNLSLFSPANVGVALEYFLTAKASGLHNITDKLAALHIFEDALAAPRARALHFISSAGAVERGEKITNLSHAISDLSSWRDAKTSPLGASSHWMAKLASFVELDLSWEQLWMEITNNENSLLSSGERTLAAYRTRLEAARTAARQLLRTSAVGGRLQGAATTMLAHVSSSFFADVASLASAQWAPLDLTAAPSLSVVAAAVAELDASGVDADTVTQLDG